MNLTMKHETLLTTLEPTGEDDRRLLVRLAQVFKGGGTITLEVEGKEPMIYDAPKSKEPRS